MPPHLRFDRQEPEGWVIAEGKDRLGEIQSNRMSFTGFVDVASAAVAAEVASRVLRDWQSGRTGIATTKMSVTPTVDGRGFSFAVPEGLWHALLLELAQRIHAATRSLRHPEPEPAA